LNLSDGVGTGVRLKVRNHNVHGALRRGVGIPQHLKRLAHSRSVAQVDL
jgi:hypothetical protein